MSYHRPKLGCMTHHLLVIVLTCVTYCQLHCIPSMIICALGSGLKGTFVLIEAVVSINFFCFQATCMNLLMLHSLHELQQRIFKCGNMQNSSLAPDAELNILTHGTTHYFIPFSNYKLLKMVRFFGTPEAKVLTRCMHIVLCIIHDDELLSSPYTLQARTEIKLPNS